MFWGERIANDIEERLSSLKGKGPLIMRDEKTASGRVHVGSMRGVAIHGVVSEILMDRGVDHSFLYEINDFDVMDGLPVYLDEATFKPYMGMPLFRVPSPDGIAPNFAEYFGREFEDVIKQTGFSPSFYRGSELYLSGKMDEAIRLALEGASTIRTIYKKVSGSERREDWLPLSVICEKCGKVGTTRASNFDGQTVAYTCEPAMVKWAHGCGYTGRISPFGGKAKLPWKVEWAAKFKVVGGGVHIEGAGKDHSTKGGARDVANHISREVFRYEPPFDIPYEFFLVGGKKMSSSKGKGSSSKEMAELMPSKIFRLALLSKDINQQVNFDPEGDTLPVLYDLYDKLASHFETVEDDYATLFRYSHQREIRSTIQVPFLPRFSQIAFLVQMPHLNLEEEVAKMKGSHLTENDRVELAERAQYAKRWLDAYAPDKFVFKIQDVLPAMASSLSLLQKESLGLFAKEYANSPEHVSGEELQGLLFDIKEKKGIPPGDLFSAIYITFLGKPMGPKAGWLLSALPREFVLQRLAEVSS